MPRLPALVSRCCRDPSSGQDWNAANWCNGGQRATLSSYGPCTLRVACPARRCVHSWTSCATSIRTVSSSCRGDQEPLLHFRGEYWGGSEPDPVLACCSRQPGSLQRTNHYNERMSLVQLQRVDFSIGGPLLLERVDLSIEANERICIVGRNGEGKSTLIKLISGELRADDGEVRVQNGIVIARLAQEVPQDTAGSVFDVVAEGLGDLGRLLARYHHLLAIGDLDA